MAANQNQPVKSVLRVLPWVLGVLITAIVFASGRTTPVKYPLRKSVRFWHRWQGDWEKQVQKIVDAFNESQTEYEVIPVSIPSGGADSKVVLGVIGGDPPDIISMFNGAVPNMAANGFLTDLGTLMTPEEKKRFFSESYPSIRETGMYRGKCYAITIGADLTTLFASRRD